jgi:DNA-binding transcriptional MerR regulator
MKDAPSVSIGRVTDLLREEFPDLTTSKVRFLESRGMIRPARSPAGYRQFSPEDIERLRFILQRQRDHFLPLKVIKSQLAGWSQGPAPAIEETEAAESEAGSAPDDYVLELQDIAARADLSRKQIRQLVSHNLIRPREEHGIPRFTSRDLAIAHQCKALIDQGLEPRHLRMIRNAAVRHVELIGGLTVAMRRNRSPEARRHAAETTRRGVEALRRLNDLLFLAELGTILDED